RDGPDPRRRPATPVWAFPPADHHVPWSGMGDGDRFVHMDRPSGQATRRRLLDAAAVLIAEVGWGRVTTRAVAERAGLPHGTVSYHFPGKQALLSEAALELVERSFPLEELRAADDLADVMSQMRAWADGPGPVD